MVDFQPQQVESWDLIDTEGGILNAFNTIGSGIIDVRQYKSMDFRVQSEIQVVATAFQGIRVKFFWISDQGVEFFKDEYTILSYDSAGSTGNNFDTLGGALIVVDQMHGPFMFYEVTALDSNTQPVTANTWLAGSSRDVQQPTYKEVSFGGDTNTYDAFTYPPGYPPIVLGGAGTGRKAGLMRPGQHRLWVGSTGPGTPFIQVPTTLGLQTVNFRQAVVAASNTNYDDILPKRTPVFCFTATGASTVTMVGTSLYNKVS